MSTKSFDEALSFLPMPRQSWVDRLRRRGRDVWLALLEGKAAADHYQSLIARGLEPGQAAEMVFRQHFGKR